MSSSECLHRLNRGSGWPSLQRPCSLAWCSFGLNRRSPAIVRSFPQPIFRGRLLEHGTSFSSITMATVVLKYEQSNQNGSTWSRGSRVLYIASHWAKPLRLGKGLYMGSMGFAPCLGKAQLNALLDDRYNSAVRTCAHMHSGLTTITSLGESTRQRPCRYGRLPSTSSIRLYFSTWIAFPKIRERPLSEFMVRQRSPRDKTIPASCAGMVALLQL